MTPRVAEIENYLCNEFDEKLSQHETVRQRSRNHRARKMVRSRDQRVMRLLYRLIIALATTNMQIGKHFASVLHLQGQEVYITHLILELMS